MKTIKRYRGHWLHPAGINESGIRWTCLHPTTGILRADTLNGLKRLIREYENQA